MSYYYGNYLNWIDNYNTLRVWQRSKMKIFYWVLNLFLLRVTEKFVLVIHYYS